MVTFGRVLREAGLEVGPGRIADALAGLDEVELTRQDDVYWTLRTTLVTRFEELEPFDRAFRAWFLGAAVRPPVRVQAQQAQRIVTSGPRSDPPRRGADDEPDPGEVEVGASADELLREKDFSAMSPEEFARARRAIEELAATRPLRRSRRSRPHPRGRELDLRRMMRHSLATSGDPVARAFRRRSEVPRKLVVLADVSGSMEAYTRAVLLFLHAAVGAGPGVEAFVFGTRLTRVTRELVVRDPERALERCASRVLDWASGTRIGDSLKAFNDEWGRRALSRGAVVVIVSDGWERADPALIGREMRRLSRAAFAVLWVTPLKGHPDYQPLAGGMRAALPYVDRFLAGNNLASLERLAAELAGLRTRHGR